MKVCLLNAVFNVRFETPEALFAKNWHTRCLAEALSDRGINVCVIQAFQNASEFRAGGVDYRMVGGGIDGAVHALDTVDPDVVHFFGMTIHRPLRRVTRWARDHGKAITASFHGGRPRRNPFVRCQQRRVFADVAAVMMPTDEHVALWRRQHVLGNRTTVWVVPEGSSAFAGISRDAAREQLGVTGVPLFAWSGRLDPVKDPLTALAGFGLILEKWPEAQLLMAYQSTELLPEVEMFLRSNPAVRKNTRMLGEIPHAEVEVLFSAADFFVQASTREIGAFSLLEAMSCGAIPIVTDIPTFRELTKDIAAARLFDCGDASALANHLHGFELSDLPTRRQQLKSTFEAKLSYRALAADYCNAFESI